MSNARNLARLLPNTSGLLPDANLAALAASKLSGQVPDANAPSGSVIQMVQTGITTSFSTSSSSYVHASAHTVTLTTSSANSKILLLCNTPVQMSNGTACRAQTTFRSSIDSYSANIGEAIHANYSDAQGGWKQNAPLMAVHSPNQASGTTITYRVYALRIAGADTVYMPDTWGANFSYSFIAMEISA